MPGVYIPPHKSHQSKDQNIQIGIWWPAADSGKLRAAAHAWRDMANALDAVHTGTQPAVLSLLADNQGPAMDAFAAYWQKWSGSGGYLPVCAQACREMAAGLERYAQAVDDARRRVEELVAEMATAVVIGVLLMPLTASLSVEVAGAVSAGLIASAAAVGFELSVTAAGIAATILGGMTVMAVEGMAMDAFVIQPERMLLFQDQKDFNWNEVLQWGEVGAAGWIFGAGVSVGFRALRAGLTGAADGVDGAGAATLRADSWGWPPAEPVPPKPGVSDAGAAEWRYQRYVFSQYQQGATAGDIMDFTAWRARYFDPVVSGGRPGRAGGAPQQGTRQALTAEGYRNVENVQLGKGNFVDMVAKNDHGGTDYVEVDDMLQRGVPPARMRAKIAEEIAALGPNDTLLYVDKNDVANRILYLPGDDVSTVTVDASLSRTGAGALR